MRGSKNRIASMVMPARLRHNSVSPIPLAFLPVGSEGKIIEFHGGRGMMQKMAEMGFTQFTKLRVVSSNFPGPVLVDVKDSRIALGGGIAMKIIVSEVL